MIVRYAKADTEGRNEHGIDGWVPLWLGDNAFGSEQLGHDVLEHRRGDAPTAEQELRTLGAVFYTRVENGLIDSPFYTGRPLAPDVMSIREDLMNRDEGRSLLPAPARNAKRVPDNTLRQMRASIASGIAMHVKEGQQSAGYDEELYGPMDYEIPGESDTMLGWMVHGYLQARSYYEQRVTGGQYSLVELYRQVNEASKRMWGHAEDGIYLRLRVDLREVHVHADVGFLGARNRFIAY
jgi:hypothetical protein